MAEHFIVIPTDIYRKEFPPHIQLVMASTATVVDLVLLRWHVVMLTSWIVGCIEAWSWTVRCPSCMGLIPSVGHCRMMKLIGSRSRSRALQLLAADSVKDQAGVLLLPAGSNLAAGPQLDWEFVLQLPVEGSRLEK